MATTTWTYDEIRSALEQRDREGLSWHALAARTGHPVWRLRYVARKLADDDDRDARAGFVELVERPEDRRRAQPPTSGDGRITIERPDGLRIHVDSGVGNLQLEAIVRAVTRAC